MNTKTITTAARRITREVRAQHPQLVRYFDAEGHVVPGSHPKGMRHLRPEDRPTGWAVCFAGLADITQAEVQARLDESAQAVAAGHEPGTPDWLLYVGALRAGVEPWI